MDASLLMASMLSDCSRSVVPKTALFFMKISFIANICCCPVILARYLRPPYPNPNEYAELRLAPSWHTGGKVRREHEQTEVGWTKRARGRQHGAARWWALADKQADTHTAPNAPSPSFSQILYSTSFTASWTLRVGSRSMSCTKQKRHQR